MNAKQYIEQYLRWHGDWYRLHKFVSKIEPGFQQELDDTKRRWHDQMAEVSREFQQEIQDIYRRYGVGGNER